MTIVTTIRTEDIVNVEATEALAFDTHKVLTLRGSAKARFSAPDSVPIVLNLFNVCVAYKTTLQTSFYPTRGRATPWKTANLPVFTSVVVLLLLPFRVPKTGTTLCDINGKAIKTAVSIIFGNVNATWTPALKNRPTVWTVGHA